MACACKHMLSETIVSRKNQTFDGKFWFSFHLEVHIDTLGCYRKCWQVNLWASELSIPLNGRSRSDCFVLIRKKKIIKILGKHDQFLRYACVVYSCCKKIVDLNDGKYNKNENGMEKLSISKEYLDSNSSPHFSQTLPDTFAAA